MSEQTRERLSALLDGELERDDLRFLLRRIGHDTESAACWSRYCIARQVLRRGPVAILSDDFSAATMARLAGEPAPAGGHRPWLRWVSGGAIAAGVAVVALTLGNPLAVRSPGVPDEVATTALPTGPSLAASSTPATSAVPVSVASRPATVPLEFRPPLLAPSQPVVASTSRTSIAMPGPVRTEPATFDPHLRSYLIRHYEASGAAGQTGFVPYALLVVPAPGTGASGSVSGNPEPAAGQH